MKKNIKKIRTLGQGGFGKVDLVECNGREVAVKYINKTHDISATLATCAINREEAKKEGRIMALFKNHDSIADILSIEGHAIFMKYFPEGSLSDKLEEGKVNEERYFMLDDIVAGLKEIHQLNFVHADLKAGNILCETHERIRCFITDFGIAVKKGTYSKAGTPGFTPPDYDKKPFSFENDIYALGKVCIELFTGLNDIDMGGIDYYNFKSMIHPDDFTNNKNAKNEPEHYRLDLMNLVHECLNPDPSKRPTLRDFYNFIGSFEG